jgi:ABC-type transport system involved in cytochrome c biogenesis permease subunit
MLAISVISGILRWAVLLGYLNCVYLYVVPFVNSKIVDRRRMLSTPFLVGTVVLHLLLLVVMRVEFGRVPFLRGALQATTLYALGLAVLTLIVQARTRSQAFGAFGVPIATMLYVISLVNRQPHMGIPDRFNTYWFELHVTSGFMGYAGFGLAFVAALMYLILAGDIRRRNLGRTFSRMPSLESLDRLGFGAVFFGFVLFTANMVTGGLWGLTENGHFWSGEPKEILSVVTWLVVAINVAGRQWGGWRGRRTALWSMLGFAASVATLLVPGSTAAGRHVL